MNYATGYALTAKDLFMGFSGRRMKMTAKECEAILGNRHKDIIAKRVFREAVRMVIDDIIENGITFLLPTRSRQANLFMKKFQGEDFSRRRKMGKWRKVDFYESLFSGYQMYLRYNVGGRYKEKPVYLDPARRDRIDELTSQGKQYY
jgi:hypothetical protein